MKFKIRNLRSALCAKSVILSVTLSLIFLLSPVTHAAPRIDYKTKLYDVSTGTTTSKVLDVTSQDGSPHSVVFNNTGSILYVLGYGNDQIYQYNLSAAYDISTATFASAVININTTAGETNSRSMLFNNTGTRMYILGGISGGKVYQYNLSTPYNISTAVYNSVALNISAQEDLPTDMIFNNTGTVLYTIGTQDDRIHKYNLSTAYNISTATFDSISLDVTGVETTPRSIIFNSDGYRLYVLGNAQNRIYRYNLTTPYDINTATTPTAALYVDVQDNQSRDIIFNNIGDKAFVLGDAGDEINQYVLGVTNTKFVEAIANNGSVTGELGFTLNGDTFNDPDNNGVLTACGGAVVCAGHQVQITNLPAGLTPNVILYRADSTTINTIDTALVGILTLSGNATNHQNVHDLPALTFTFANSAFNSTAAAGVTNAIAASGGVGIDFADNVTYPMIYSGNLNTGGSVPVDASSPYVSGATVTVLGNTGLLVRTGHTFNNWNTAVNGSGTAYAPAATFSILATTTLYAQWTALTSATVVMLDNLTNESGDTGLFSIVLDSAPSANVTIALSSSNTAEGTVPASVTFTTANWNVPQIITVTGVDDVVSDGSQNFNIVTGDVTSADLAYDALDGTSINDPIFSNQDNDAPAIVLTVVATTTTEAGGTVTLQVSLLSQPGAGADVTIPLSVSDATEGSVPASITILNANWNTPASNVITVTGVDDAIVDGNIIYSIVTGDPSSTDLGYDGLTAASVADVALVNIDNDVNVTYNGNTNTGGAIPIDGSSPYTTGGTVTALGNSGGLVKTGFTFNNWNTAANGSGTAFAPTATFTISANTILYAQWIPLPTYALTYNGNSNTGGSVPTDILSPYASGSTVTVQGNTASLSRTGLTFNNWNTAANGSGVAYAPGDAFTINQNTTVYAQWSDTTPPSDPVIGAISPNPAATGTVVTLTLSGIEVGATVSVDDFVCTPSPADATGNVTCVTTIGTSYDGGVRQVTVTDTAGNVNTNIMTSVVTVSSAPIVTSVVNINGGLLLLGCSDPKATNYSVRDTISNNCFYSKSSNYDKPNLIGGGEPNVPAEFAPYVCVRYLREYIYPGRQNAYEEVKKLQSFLNEQGESLLVDGKYDADDVSAVKRFQERYRDQILTPWELKEASGIVGRTTAAKINLMSCSTNTSCPYFTENLKPEDVALEAVKVQDFLNIIFAPTSGYPTRGIALSKTMTTQTVAKVREYQTVYKDAVLKPLGLKSSTGWWFEKSRASANKLMNCSM